MKNLLSISFILLVFISLSGCTKKTARQVRTDTLSSPAYVFYMLSDLNAGDIDVYVDNVLRGKITAPLAKKPGDCFDEHALVVTQKPGNYLLKAYSSGGKQWTANLSFNEGQCNYFEFKSDNTDDQAKCYESLEGTWRRANDARVPNSAGMIVEFANGKGIITSVPDGVDFYKKGMVKWVLFNSKNCRIYDLTTAGSHYNHFVHFPDANTFVINNEIMYVREN
ncbi:MAG: hypothetical protein H6550_13200 [Chitinophagales bacterium]|nr:hypothetical protein [Chitinophagales bacterium]